MIREARRWLTRLGRNGAAVVVLLAAAVACGKKGDPLPPLRKNPQPPTALTIAQRGDLLQVSCAAPRLTLDGARLGVMDIELLRADGAGDFRQLALLAEQIKAAPGETLVFDQVKPEAASVVRFAVTARSEKHDSAPAGPIEYSVREIPPAPTNLLAALEPGTHQPQLGGSSPVDPGGATSPGRAIRVADLAGDGDPGGRATAGITRARAQATPESRGPGEARASPATDARAEAGA